MAHFDWNQVPNATSAHLQQVTHHNLSGSFGDQLLQRPEGYFGDSSQYIGVHNGHQRSRSLDLKRELPPLILRTPSDDSMSGLLTGPKFKSKAPKNSK